MFSSDPKLSTTTRTEARKGLFGQKGRTATKNSAKQAAASVRNKTSDVSGGPPRPAPSKEHQPGMYKNR